MTTLAAAAVRVRLGGTEILRGVDFVAVPGLLIGLLGPNGAGKTTLIEALAGLRRPDAGTIRLGGVDLAAAGANVRARAIGYLEQGARCHWPVAVHEAVALGRLPHRGAWTQPDAADGAAVAAAMAACDVAHLAARDVTTLSGGERARVLFARCLAGDPEILLADEPAAGLDPRHQIRCLDLLAGRAAAGVAVVAVMHDLALALRYCDRICLLDRGEVAALATPAALLAGDAIERVYGVDLARHCRDGRPYAVPWSLRTEPQEEGYGP